MFDASPRGSGTDAIATVDHVGVSRKIESREERGRLRGIVREFREQHGFTGGVIIRTAAAGRPKEDILSDLSYFHRVWTERMSSFGAFSDDTNFCSLTSSSFCK